MATESVPAERAVPVGAVPVPTDRRVLALAGLLADRVRLAEALDGFAAAFTTLSTLFATAPTPDLLDRIRDPALLADWPFAADPDSAAALALLAQSATTGSDGTGEDRAAVQRDYNRLFYGPGPMIAAPYESVHRSDEHLLFDRETVEVRAAYAEFNLAAPRLHKEPDDHLSLELAFVAALCVRALDAIDATHDLELTRILAAAQAFLDDHLLTWAPDLLTQAGAGAQTLFYEGVSALTDATLTRAAAAFLTTGAV